MIRRIASWFGWIAGAAVGATIGVWANEPYPVDILERNVVTPVVRPGDPLKVEVVAYRRARCENEINRTVTDPDGDRTEVSRIVPRTFGRLGRDVYVLEIPTSTDTPMGPAEIYSTGAAICNPWQRAVRPVMSGSPWIDHFEYGPQTIRVPGKHEDEYPLKLGK